MNPRGEELSRLYRDTVLDHSRNPHNFRRIEAAQAQATGHNPLCGDRVSVYLQLDDGRISDAAFEATGCAISVASASMMTDRVRALSIEAARAAIAEADALFTGSTTQLPAGDLAALAGVRSYPSRIRCALLPWRTLEAALDGTAAPITTKKGS